ncbi:phage/plasmid primase, P4 family [Savagea faecisuis]|uniref:Phage/plasmid primase, P4 family n=1 Tax=Savagea faecisuis TaxID=1274803 RepID=A0ABW3GVM9_9BACL
MRAMHLYTAPTVGRENSLSFSNQAVITDEHSLRDAVAYDHVCAEFDKHQRSSANFLAADNVVLDLDNDHSDDPQDWIDMTDITTAFPNVSCVVVSSRNHQKQKGNLSARPRFHVYFPTEVITDAEEYKQLKTKIADTFPFFDRNALDSARFIFGVSHPDILIHDGDQLITEFLIDDFEAWDADLDKITEGSRNNTMSHYAGRVIIRYGDTDEAKALFDEKAALCEPPLPDEELALIWQSALKFGRKIASLEGYIPPEKYHMDFLLKPSEYSDIGQAEVFVQEYETKVRYSPSTKYLVYNGSYWEESDLKAQGLSQDLAIRQVEEAESLLKKARAEMKENGALDLLESLPTKKAITLFNKAQAHAYRQYLTAENYKKYAVKRGDTRAIHATTKEAKTRLEIYPGALDSDEFLLNTPSHTLDLKTGERFEHHYEHFITKQTAVDPSDDNADIWQDALKVFFEDDQELIEYVQKVAGLATIGKVYVEAMIIAYGDGRNGKSTFWNVISRVLGNYSGTISADILTVGFSRNAKPELAEAKGKRLLIAAELEEGMRLNTSNVKQLSSTDEINAEKKYKDPFKFVPSHTLVLYTNHLPKVGAVDAGTWRRLIVIPFQAKIEGSSDIKNYADYLFHEAGGAILQWIIEGAGQVIQDGYKIKQPKVVQDAIQKYKEANDWFHHFITERCEVGETLEEKSGELYQEYRAFSMSVGEYARSTAEFYTALEGEGFERKRTKHGRMVLGLQLKSEFN